MRQLLPWRKWIILFCNPKSSCIRHMDVSLLSSIYSSPSAKGSYRDFMIEIVCQGSVSIEYQIMFECPRWWYCRIYRLILSFHLPKFITIFRGENICLLHILAFCWPFVLIIVPKDKLHRLLWREVIWHIGKSIILESDTLSFKIIESVLMQCIVHRATCEIFPPS